MSAALAPPRLVSVQRGQASGRGRGGFEALVESGVIDEPCGGGLDTWLAVRQGHIEPRRIFGKGGRLLDRQNRVHEETAAAMAIEIRLVIAGLASFV